MNHNYNISFFLTNFYFCVSLSFSIEPTRRPPFEIFIHNHTYDVLTVTNTALNVIWDGNKMITDQYTYGELEIPNNEYGEYYGFNYIYSGEFTWPEFEFSNLGFGIYEISIPNIGVSFSLDLTDSNMNSPIDIDMKIDEDGLWWKWSCSCNTGLTMDWSPIIDGDVFTIWGLFESCSFWVEDSPNTTSFQPTTPTNLMIGDTDIHPLLTWNFSEPDAAQYEVWRKDEVNKFSIWYKIAENLTSTTFTDTEVYLDEVGILFSYKIIAVSGDGSKYSPDYSNVESVVG